jgi:hypothetical protein
MQYSCIFDYKQYIRISLFSYAESTCTGFITLLWCFLFLLNVPLLPLMFFYPFIKHQPLGLNNKVNPIINFYYLTYIDRAKRDSWKINRCPGISALTNLIVLSVYKI